MDVTILLGRNIVKALFRVQWSARTLIRPHGEQARAREAATMLPMFRARAVSNHEGGPSVPTSSSQRVGASRWGTQDEVAKVVVAARGHGSRKALAHSASKTRVNERFRLHPYGTFGKMDWFERLTGFRETAYDDTRAKLEVDGRQLKSLVNGKSYGIGELELVSLQNLRDRDRVKSVRGPSGRVKMSIVTGDVREMHRSPQYAGALFQVASQFNLLEMVSPEITPEHGVTRYQYDRTQGPACAIAAGAATIYRNYFAPLGGANGQTKDRQFDGLADLGKTLSRDLNEPVETLWSMRNGYALCTCTGLDAIGEHIRSLRPEQVDILRGKLCIGIHRDVEVTEAEGEQRPVVSQAFCSALPVAYTGIPASHWEPFASLILEAAYEATMWEAALNARRGGSNIVLLTLLGGGAFGNGEDWILAAVRRALELASGFDMDVRIVS
jgi:hypothetical protein